MEGAMNKYLAKVYFNPANPASYGGLDDLYKAVKDRGYSRKKVKNWLLKQEVYTLHKEPKRQFKRPRVIVSAKYQQFDGDTMNMTAYADKNKGYKHVLVVIDIFTRYGWTVPLCALTAIEMKRALSIVFKDQKPIKLRTDKGSEFLNAPVRDYLKEINVHHFTTTHELKANYAERFIKTLKTRITRFMNKYKDSEWTNILEDVTFAYNNSKHRSIQMTPTEARDANSVDLWKIQYDQKFPKIKIRNKPPREKSIFNLEVGDRVRLARYRAPFVRAYDEKWTYEIFTVTERDTQQDIPLYKIKSWDNEAVLGAFYQDELEKVLVGDDVSYSIEHVLNKKRIRKKDGFIVKWYGWPEKYNSWVSVKDMAKKYKKKRRVVK